MGKIKNPQKQCDFCRKTYPKTQIGKSFALVNSEGEWIEVWACEECSTHKERRQQRCITGEINV